MCLPRLIFLITLLTITNQITSMETNAIQTNRDALALKILHYAAISDCTAIHELLSKSNISGGEILSLAAKKGEFNATRTLLDYGIGPNSCDNEGIPALHNATIKGYIPIMELLINNGASLNHQIRKHKDHAGATPLHMAVLFRQLEAAQFLINRKANLTINTYKKSTPLELAIDISCTPIITALLNNGAHTHLQYANGSTLLHRSVSKKDTMNILIACRDMNINAKDKEGNTPLHKTILFCHEQINKSIIEYKHNLFDDAIINDSALILLLDNAEIIINAVNYADKTPLDLVRGKNKKLEDLLLKHNAKTYNQLGGGEPTESICTIQ